MQESLFAQLLNPFFDSIDPLRKSGRHFAGTHSNSSANDVVGYVLQHGLGRPWELG